MDFVNNGSKNTRQILTGYIFETRRTIRGTARGSVGHDDGDALRRSLGERRSCLGTEVLIRACEAREPPQRREARSREALRWRCEDGEGHFGARGGAVVRDPPHRAPADHGRRGAPNDPDGSGDTAGLAAVWAAREAPANDARPKIRTQDTEAHGRRVGSGRAVTGRVAGFHRKQ